MEGLYRALALWKLTEGLDALNARNMASSKLGMLIKRFDDPAGDSYDQYQFDIHERHQLAFR